MHKSASSTGFVAQVKARLNLAEHVIIPDIGVPQRQEHRLAWCCPFHEDHHPSLFLNRAGNRFAALAAVRAPEGNDVTGYHQASGDVRPWVLALVGNDAQFPLWVVISPDGASLPGLAVPAGRWRRMDDGSIVVVYASAEEMIACEEATRVCGGRKGHIGFAFACGTVWKRDSVGNLALSNAGGIIRSPTWTVFE